MSGLSWFRVDNDVVDHPKVHELAALLKDPNAGWYLIRLWSWTMRYAARGRLQNGAGTCVRVARAVRRTASRAAQSGLS